MRVLFINNLFPQPSQTFVIDQIRHARGLGLDVSVFAKRYNPQLAADHAPDLAPLVIHDRPRNGETFARIAGGLARHPAMVSRYLSGKRTHALHASDLVCAAQVPAPPDVIIANFGQNGIVAARLKQAFFPKARLAVIFHGWDVSAYVAANGWEVYRRAAPAIDIALAVNRVWAGLLSEHTPMRRIVVHHLGVDLDKAATRHARPAGTPFTILFVGRMVEKKGLSVLLDALARLKDEGFAPRLAAVGEGPEEAALKAQAERLGLAEQVVFHGRQPHEAVLRLMGEADCLALPSVTAADGDQEGIPVTLMEAMASGLPVVSTYHSGIPELVTDDETGLLVPERDAATLAAALRRLMTEPALGPRLAERGRDFVAAAFNAETQNRLLFDRILGRDDDAP